MKTCLAYGKAFLLICALVMAGFASVAHHTSAQNITPVTVSTPEEQKSSGMNTSLKDSLEKTLLAERQNYQQLEVQLQHLLYFRKDIDAEVNAYKIEISAYNSLLLASTSSTEEFETVSGSAKSALDHIGARVKELQKQSSDSEQLRVNTEEQYRLNQQQLESIKADSLKHIVNENDMTELLDRLQSLTKLLAEKRELLNNILGVQSDLIHKLQGVQQSFTELIEQFTKQLDERKARELFERKSPSLSVLGWNQFRFEFEHLYERLRLLFTARSWIENFQVLWQAERLLLFRPLLLGGIMLLMLLRLRQFLLHIQNPIFCERYPWRCIVLQMACNSLFLSTLTAFLYTYMQIHPLDSTVPISQLFLQFLMIFLFTRWLLSFLKFWSRKHGDSAPVRLISSLRIFIRSMRSFSLVYMTLLWALGNSSVLLPALRIFFEIGLLIWSVPFWKVFRETPQQIFPGSPEARKTLRSVTVSIGYLIVLTGLLLETSGYGLLAQYWFFSWGKSVIVLLWAISFFQVLREWEHRSREAAQVPSEADQPKRKASYLGWFFGRVCWTVSPLLLIIGILVAWGAKQYVLVGVVRVLRYPITIGGLTIQILGMLYAVLILLFCDLLNRVWRHVLKENILSNSGLALGLQASIMTISSYAIWGIGILWALKSIGIGTTSLAVAFGALGIGLGFGLQGMFNNFISGLILLFERPIEVGNVVEIGGNWGMVEKINVRATIVRTYDNSALIIPNADIVGNQLTNWTFRDARMRRTIQVGVAYGSDVKLVEQTLYEIAQNHPRVMADPAPMVLFSDFGESALIFKLRVWTLIDYGLTSETELRFEIERSFREKKITIAFPQLDVHFHAEEGVAYSPLSREETS